MNTPRSAFLVAAALVSICSFAFAQGADLCANAQAITGTGNFAFDNTTATTDGVPDPLCNAAATSDISNDVWFAWTAAANGSFTFATCGLASIDSKIAVYDGSCGGPILACNDDNCSSLQSSVDVSVTNSHVYIVRLGNYPGAAPGTGQLSVAPTGQLAVLDTQINPANGHTYMLLAGGSWTNAEATAVALGGHLATVRSQAEHDWIRTTWHNYQGVDIDMWIGLTDQAVEGTFVWISGEPVTYTNWDLGEPNNGGTSGIPENYADMRKNNPAAYWNDLQNAPPVGAFHYNPHGVVELGGTPAVGFCFGDGSATACPCANNSTPGNGEGCLSSLGIGGKLGTTGFASIASDTLALVGTQMPSAPGLYFQGTTQLNGGLGVMFGDGLRCAGGSIIRLGTKTNVAGASQYPAAGDPSVSVRGLDNAGDVRTYQMWYRNAAAFCTASTFNLTNGVQVTWAP